MTTEQQENVAILVGNLATEVRISEAGHDPRTDKPFVFGDCRLAVSRQLGGTSFFTVKFSGKAAIIASDNLTKGARIRALVEPVEETWRTDDNQPRSRVVFRAIKVEILNQAQPDAEIVNTIVPEQLTVA